MFFMVFIIKREKTDTVYGTVQCPSLDFLS